MAIKTVVEDGYRIVLPEPLHSRFHVGDEIVIDQDRDGRVFIDAVPGDEEILATLLSGEESELGRQLRLLRQQIVESGIPLLDPDAIEREINDRYGDL